MNMLTDVLPPKVRKVVYAVLFLVTLGYGAYEAADGDWWKAGFLLASSLVNGMAASNTAKPELEVPEEAGRHVARR